ncbi:hypothetical protein DMM45_06480 [Salmonella enterica subsp. enterica serovar Agona]|nr:hypothetical protein [Salmonella enterica subsp. enterica serovar Agona]
MRSPGRPVAPRRGESPFCRPLLRGFSPQWTFPMGRPSPRHGAAVRGRTQNFLPGAYFHERRSLNNFHRDRVITFEQIAE